tara:strand:+ start:72 stop:584 length:513 start_codon:yes stop_codon:yes gene_type:complete
MKVNRLLFLLLPVVVLCSAFISNSPKQRCAQLLVRERLSIDALEILKRKSQEVEDLYRKYEKNNYGFDEIFSRPDMQRLLQDSSEAQQNFDKLIIKVFDSMVPVLKMAGLEKVNFYRQFQQGGKKYLQEPHSSDDWIKYRNSENYKNSSEMFHSNTVQRSFCKSYGVEFP